MTRKRASIDLFRPLHRFWWSIRPGFDVLLVSISSNLSKRNLKITKIKKTITFYILNSSGHWSYSDTSIALSLFKNAPQNYPKEMVRARWAAIKLNAEKKREKQFKISMGSYTYLPQTGRAWLLPTELQRHMQGAVKILVSSSFPQRSHWGPLAVRTTTPRKTSILR